MVTDPVCGMWCDPWEAPAEIVYKDRTYYFCSLECRGEFEQNPDRYSLAEAATS